MQLSFRSVAVFTIGLGLTANSVGAFWPPYVPMASSGFDLSPLVLGTMVALGVICTLSGIIHIADLDEVLTATPLVVAIAVVAVAVIPLLAGTDRWHMEGYADALTSLAYIFGAGLARGDMGREMAHIYAIGFGLFAVFSLALITLGAFELFQLLALFFFLLFTVSGGALLLASAIIGVWYGHSIPRETVRPVDTA